MITYMYLVLIRRPIGLAICYSCCYSDYSPPANLFLVIELVFNSAPAPQRYTYIHVRTQGHFATSPIAGRRNKMPACNRRVAADYRSRGPLGKKNQEREGKKKSYRVRDWLRRSLDHTRQCRSQPGSQEPGRLRGGCFCKRERR